MQDRKMDNRIILRVTEAVCAILLGAGSFKAFINLFSLEWGRGNWYKGGFTQGIVKLWNDIADAFGESSFTILAKYAGESKSCGLILTLILLAFIVIGYFVARSRSLWFSLLYLIPLAVLPLAFDLRPGYAPVIAISGGLALLAMLRNLDKRIDFWPLVITGAVMAIVFALCVNPYTRGLLDRPSEFAGASEKLSAKIDTTRYGKNPLGDGTFKDARKKGTALKVTMEEPEAMYLRGFVGETFTGDRWQALSPTNHYEGRDLAESLGKADFKALGQLGQAAELAGAEEAEYGGKIKIETVKASSKYAYVPYEIKNTAVKGTKNWNSSFLTGKGLRGADEYSYNSYGNLTGVWTDVTGQLYSAAPDDELNKYVAAESHYNTWVYKEYTELSDADADAIEEILGSAGGGASGHVGYKTAINKIVSYFDDNVIYTKRIKKSEKALSTVLEKNKGNDTHFATAATLMFRYYGIPARYVEGYLITMDDAMEMEPEEAYKISMKNEHAWTEIYVDGAGWIPIEVCSEYYGIMPEADMSVGLESKSKNSPFDNTEATGKSRVVTEVDEEETMTIPWKKLFIIAGLILLAAVLAYVLYRAIRLLIAYYRRRKAFGQPDVKQAICAMYDYAIKRNLKLSDSAVVLGTEAAYSSHSFAEEDRRTMREALKEASGKSK